jgi:competence protein ComEC
VALLLLALVLLQAVLRQPRPGPRDPLHRLGGGAGDAETVLVGTVLSAPRPPGCAALLQVERAQDTIPTEGRTTLAFATCPDLREGWKVRVEGRLASLRPAAHPLLSGSAERLARQGVWTRLRVARLEVLRRPALPIAAMRRRIAARLVEVGGVERGGLLAALVLGGAVVPLPEVVRETFRVAGLSHALAASGFHLSVLLGAVMVLGRSLGGALRLALAAAAMTLFLLLAGPQPSVVRAVLMAGAALLALESGRRGRPLGILAVTVSLMLLLRPDWLGDVGFQLSVAATAGLVVSAGPLEEVLAERLPLPRLAQALAVPVAASLWTLPLQVHHFGAVPLYAVVANLAAAPLLGPLTLGAMGLAVVAVTVPPLLAVLAVPVLLMARLLLALAAAVAALPMAQWQTGRPLPLLVLLLSLGLLGWALPRGGRGLRQASTALLAVAVTVHLSLLAGDRLLLVHQGGGASGRDLLVARHAGRGALITSHGDGPVCRQARRLIGGLGVQRLDWALLLDPVAPEDPGCWQELAGRVVAYGEAEAPLLAGQRLSSPGLEVEALSMDSHALLLRMGSRRWLLLPDRQGLWAWQQQRGGAVEAAAVLDGVWMGFDPRAHELRGLLAGAIARQGWISGGRPPRSPLPPGWRFSGERGWLASG